MKKKRHRDNNKNVLKYPRIREVGNNLISNKFFSSKNNNNNSSNNSKCKINFYKEKVKKLRGTMKIGRLSRSGSSNSSKSSNNSTRYFNNKIPILLNTSSIILDQMFQLKSKKFWRLLSNKPNQMRNQLLSSNPFSNKFQINRQHHF